MFRSWLSFCCCTAAAGGVGLGAAASSSSETFPDLNVTLKLAGSVYAKPLLTQWIQTYTNSIAFTEEYRGPMTFNTSMDASEFIATQSSAASASPPYAFLQSDRPLTETERAALSQAMNGPVIHFPAATSAMAVVYNLDGVSGLDGTTRLQLTADVVAKIFTGNINKWNDDALVVDNPALATHDKPIQVFVRGETHCSATYDLAHDYLSAFNAAEWNKAGEQDGPAQFVASATRVYSGADMIAFIQNTTNAIGYVKVAEARDVVNTKSAALCNRAGAFVKYAPDAVLKAVENTTYPNPTQGAWANFSLSVATHPDVYPGATLSYFIVGSNLTYMKDPVSSDAVNDFLEWYNTHRDALAVPAGFQAIPPTLRALNLATLPLVKWAPYPIGPTAEKFSLAGVGSSFPSELIKVWIAKLSARKDWRDKHDGVLTFVSPNGDDSSSFLTEQATSPQYPYIQVDNHLNESSYQQLRSGVGEVLTLPFVISAVSVVYNLQDAESRGIKVRPLNLTADLTCMIFTGRISMWNDSRLVALNPGLVNHNASIHVIVRNETVGSTTYDLVHDYFGAFNAAGYDPNGDQLGRGQFVQSARVVKGGSGMTTAVKNTPNSIGYSKKKTAEQGGLGGWSAALQNVAGKFVTPTSDAVMAAANDITYPASDASWADFYLGRSPSPSAYPASAMAYFLVSRNLWYLDRGNRSALRDFLVWVASDHQAKAELPLGFVPVVPSVRQKNMDAIATLCLDCTQPTSMKDMSSSEARRWVVAVIVIIIIAVVASATFMCWRHDACAACKQRMAESRKSRLPMEDTEEQGHGMLSPIGYDQHRGSLPTGPSLALDEHDVDLEENDNASYHKKRKNVNDTTSPVEVEMDDK